MNKNKMARIPKRDVVDSGFSTKEMEVALMASYLDVYRDIVVPNATLSTSNSFIHECDLLSVTKAGYATEIEIKVSKGDLLADKKKPHNHESDYIKSFYFAVPGDMVDYTKERIPERAGLLGISKIDDIWAVRCHKNPIIPPKPLPLTMEMRCKLAHLGAMRLLKYMAKELMKEQNGNPSPMGDKKQ